MGGDVSLELVELNGVGASDVSFELDGVGASDASLCCEELLINWVGVGASASASATSTNSEVFSMEKVVELKLNKQIITIRGIIMSKRTKKEVKEERVANEENNGLSIYDSTSFYSSSINTLSRI